MRFGYVGPDGALGEPAGALYLACLFGKHVYESFADSFSLEFRIGYAAAGGKEAVGGAHSLDVQAFVLVVFEYVLEFILAQQAMVHKYALKLVAYGFVDKHRGDSRINAPGQAEDYDIIAHLGLDGGNLLLYKGDRVQFLSVVHISSSLNNSVLVLPLSRREGGSRPSRLRLHV